MSGQTDNENLSESAADKRPPSPPSDGLEGDRHGFRVNAVARGVFGRIRVWSITWRVIFYGFMVVTLGISLGIVALSQYLKPDIIRAWLQEFIAHETGGKAEIGGIQVSVTSGISLSNLKIFPPELVNDRVPNNEARYEKNPALECERIDIAYSLLGLLAGQINIRAMRIHGLKISIEKKSEKTNIDGIRRYRQALLNDHETIPSESQAGSSVPLDTLISRFNPTLFYMPLKVIVRNIGISNLSFELKEDISKNSLRITRFMGSSFDISGFWHKAKSRWSIALGSLSEDPLVYSISERNPTDKTGHLKVLREVEVLAAFEISLEDLHKLDVNFTGRINKSLPLPIRHDEALFAVQTKLDLKYDKLQLDIEKLVGDVPGVLGFSLSGNIRLIDILTKKVSLDLDHSLHLDIGSLFERVGAMVQGVKGRGSLDLEHLTINGSLNLDDMAGVFAGYSGTPSISGDIRFSDVGLDVEDPALRIDGLNGSLKFGGSKTFSGDGFGVDELLQLTMDSFSLRQMLSNEEAIDIEATDLHIENASRILLPRLEAQMARFSVVSEHLRIAGQKFKGWEAPFYFELSADGDKELSRNAAALNMEWKGLFEISSGIGCHARCNRFRGNLRHKIFSFGELYGALAGIVEEKIPREFRPLGVAGALDLQIDVQGIDPPKSRAEIERFFSSGDIDFKTRVALSRVNFRTAYKSLEMKDAAVRLEANGNLRTQHLVFESRSGHLAAEAGRQAQDAGIDSIKGHPASDTQKAAPKRLTVYDLNTRLDLKNAFPTPPKLNDFFGKTRAEINLKAGLGQLDRGGTPIPGLAGSSIGLDLTQEGLKHIELRAVKGHIPAIGLEVFTRGQTVLNKDYVPIEFDIESKMSLGRTDILNILPGVASQGSLHAIFELASSNMTEIRLGGGVKFENFGLTVANPNGAAEPTLMISSLNGQIPISQTIKVPRSVLKNWGIKTEHDIAKSSSSAEIDKKDPNLAKNYIKQNQGTSESQDYRRVLADIASQYIDKKDKVQEQTSSKALGVDYGSVKGFFPKRKPLTVKQFIAANLEMTDLILDVEWRENLVGLNEFAIGIIGGELQGNVQIMLANDLERIIAKPKEIDSFIRKINTNIQATRLDTRKILDRLPDSRNANTRNIALFSNPYIDATIHYLWNVESRDLGGSIDITTIGKEQVRMLLSYVDPTNQDQTINDIRKALYLGEVRQVSIPIKNGEIGLDVDIRALSIPIPTPKLTKFPVNQLIDNAIRKDRKAAQTKDSAA